MTLESNLATCSKDKDVLPLTGNSTPGICEKTSQMWTGRHTTIFITVLATIAKNHKQHKCISAE